jgi:transposase
MDIKQIIQEVLTHLHYNEYISPEEAGKRLSVHPNTIRDWCHNYDNGKKPQLPYTKFGAKCLRIKTRDFIAFCQSHEC